MNSIPILRFPILVIREILSTMSPFELIHLSMTSKRTKRIVTISSKTKYQNKFRLEASTNEHYGISIKTTGFIWDYRFVDWKYKECRNEFQLRKYTDNPLEDFKKLSDCIQDIFGLEFQHVIFFMKRRDHNEHRLLTDYLKTKQESYKEFDILGRSGNDEDIKYLLDNLKFSDSFRIDAGIKDNFQMALPQNVDSLRIVHAKFVSFEQLLSLNCECIKLIETSFTQQDLNMFLKSWAASESNFNLVYSKIGFEFQAWQGILKDIPYLIGEERHFQNKYIDREVGSSMEIKRIDGKTARIVFRAESTTRYTMIVFIY